MIIILVCRCPDIMMFWITHYSRHWKGICPAVKQYIYSQFISWELTQCVSVHKSLRNSGKIESRKLSLALKPQYPEALAKLFTQRCLFLKAEKTKCSSFLSMLQSSKSTVCSQKHHSNASPTFMIMFCSSKLALKADVRTKSHFLL